jgi:hypothetical protein
MTKFTTSNHAAASATDKMATETAAGVKGHLTPLQASALAISPPQGRLTLTTAVPVTVSDVTAATTIYYTPYVGVGIPIYDGTDWRMTAFTELSNATAQSSTGSAGPAAVTTNSNYDLFVWSDSGTLRLTRGPLWTSDTGRGTGAGTTQLTLTNGIYLNTVAITNGPGALRGTYVGTVRSDGSSQINDSNAFRMVWNCYNRRPRSMRVIESTASWTYSTAALRQANNSAANQLAFVRGLNEDIVEASIIAGFQSSTATPQRGIVLIGLDSVAADATGDMRIAAFGTSTVSGSPRAELKTFPGLGYHYLTWIEFGAGVDTQTWSGVTTGIHGKCES